MGRLPFRFCVLFDVLVEVIVVHFIFLSSTCQSFVVVNRSIITNQESILSNIPTWQKQHYQLSNNHNKFSRNHNDGNNNFLVSRNMVPNDDESDTQNSNKFGMVQRIDSLKSLVVGAIVGSLCLAPIDAIHTLLFTSTDLMNMSRLGQLEFDCDAGAVQAGLFAIVYRYCIRQDENVQLNQGVVGSFVLVRTLSRIVIPSYCTAIVLDCGAPLGYLDWYLLQQLLWNGIESGVLFGAAAFAMEYAMRKGYISKFPG